MILPNEMLHIFHLISQVYIWVFFSKKPWSSLEGWPNLLQDHLHPLVHLLPRSSYRSFSITSTSPRFSSIISCFCIEEKILLHHWFGAWLPKDSTTWHRVARRKAPWISRLSKYLIFFFKSKTCLTMKNKDYKES